MKIIWTSLALFSFAVTITTANASGLQAELRSSAAILPAGAVAPTAPAGGVVVGAQAWACDASQGFAPIVAVDGGVQDPRLAIGTGGVRLPISATTVPASCGQIATHGDGSVYITQAVVDTKNTPSAARGILRALLDLQTGAMIGQPAYIATTAGLDGNQPTAVAVGPDGNLYVGFLKNGNVKRVVGPGAGTTQTVQSVGNTPQGHSARAFAFIGSDLYIASVDALSVIPNAISPACTGGCNATVIADGFSGVSHVGVTSDGIDAVYFAVSGSAQITGSSQVWRYTPSLGTFSFVAQSGVDRNGANGSNFSFVAGKTNLLNLDSGGNLWVGDDTSNAAATGAGRLWTISAQSLATLPPGTTTGGTNTQAIFNVLRGPWSALVNNTLFVPTFNADGTFTATITSAAGVITTDSGTWTLTPPNVPSEFTNAQGHITFTDSQGVVLVSGDTLLVNADELVMMPVTDSIDPIPTIAFAVFTKMTI
jgi:hypothetical protein